MDWDTSEDDELQLTYRDLIKAHQRICELEKELSHYKQWLKERTSELEERICELEKRLEFERTLGPNKGHSANLTEMESGN